MICPQTKRVCTAPTECGTLGCVVEKNATPPPPPPTLADIERLVSKHEEAVYHLGYEQLRKGADTKSWAKFRDEVNEARAALMTAIRLYGRE